MLLRNLFVNIKIIIVKSLVFIFGNLIFIFFRFRNLFLTKPKNISVNSLNIILMSELAKKGGASKVAYKIFRFLQESGKNAEMFVGRLLPDQSAEKGINLIKENRDFFTNILTKFDRRNRFYDFLNFKSRSIFKEDAYKTSGIFHIHNIHFGYFSKFLLPKISREKILIWTLHDNVDLFEVSNSQEYNPFPGVDRTKLKLLRSLSYEIFRNLSLTVVSPSKWLLQKAKSGVFRENDHRLIYNGVDENIFKIRDKSELRSELNLPRDKTILLLSGVWGINSFSKDSMRTILQIVEKYKNNENVFFLVFGGTDLDMGKNSLILPYIENELEIAKYYSSSDIFLYPSLWDNCPLSILEAMGSGTPVVTYQTGGIPELIDHDQNGFVSPYWDVDQFCKYTDILVNDKNLQKTFGETAHKKFIENFTLTKMQNSYETLYAELLGKYYAGN